MPLSKSARLARTSSFSRNTRSRKHPGRLRDTLGKSALAAVEAIEQRIMLTGTPVLGVNFATTRTVGTDATLASTDTAGLAPMSNWNNAISANQGPTTGTLTGLTDASGAATGAAVSWQSNGTWDNANGATTNNFAGADKTLMTGYLWYNGAPGDTAAADKVATSASLTSGTLDGNGVLFTGLTGSSYDVVVYSLSDGGGQGGVTTVTGTNTSSMGVHDATSSNYVLGKNYMLFLNMHPQNGDLLVTPDGVTFRNNYNGIELLNPSAAAPAAPTGLAVTQGASGAANLSWTAASPQGDEYLVQRSASASGPWTTLATLDKSVTTYTDLTPPVGQSVYQVVAVNSAGQAASNVTSPITIAALPSAILGIHFGADYTTDIAAGNALAPTDTAGVAPMSHWNNETGGSATPSSATGLTDATGATTGVGVSWETNNVWGSGGNDNFSGADKTLMDGYLDNHGGTAAATATSLTSGTLNGNGVLLTGLTAPSYNLIVYSLGDAAGRSGVITVTGANSEGLPNLTEPSTAYVRGQNYEEFVGLHPLNNSLLITPRSSDARNPINAIELVTQTSTAAPAAPTNLTAALNAAHTAAVLNWTENGTGAQEYIVERATNAIFTTGVTTIGTLNPNSGNTATFTDNGMTAGVQYWYRIGAYNDLNGGTEVDSNIAGPVFVPVSNSNNPIGINFASGSNGSTFNLNPTDTAGAYPIANWNNAPGATGTSGIVVDDTGAGTGLGVQWQADTTWDDTATSGENTDAFTGADHTLMAGYLDDFGTSAANGNGGARATGASLTSGTLDGVGELVTGLNQPAYDVVVYGQSGGLNRNYSITVTGTAASTQLMNGVPAPASQYVLGQNVLVFPDVVPSNHNILFTPDTTSFRDDTQGIELLPIATSAPTAVTLSGTYDAANAAADLTWTGGGTNTLLYQVQRSTSASGPWTTVSQSLPNTTSAVDNLPLVGQGYFYRLVSTNSFNGGSTAASNVVGPFQAPAGSGSEAHYFPQAFWDGQPTVTQFVTTVNENFPGGTPDASIRNFNNSMVFTGQVKANEAGLYTFVGNSDDDGYLYVDGQLVSQDPGGHGARNATTLSPISLAAGSTHDFVFLVNQGGGGEAAHMLWVTPSMAAANPPAAPVTIPNTNLTSAIGTPTQPTGLTAGTAGSNSVDFTFTSDNDAVVRYLLQRSTDGSNWITVAQTNPSSSFGPGSPNTNIRISDSSALPSTTYQYRVVGMNFDHTSTPSAPVTVATVAATQGPGVEVRYYNGEIASQSSGQDPRNFAVNGLPAEFQSFDFQGPSQNYTGSPDPTLYSDIARINRYGFATVFTGQIVTDGAGMYTFVTNTSDDGYLFVNGTLVSSDPGIHALRDATTLTPLSLAANTAYDFVFIQQQVNSGIGSANPAGATLSWIEPGQTTESAIPAASGTSGGVQKLMRTPDMQTIDASGHITETAGASAAGTVTATGAPGGGIALTWADQSLSELWFEVQRATSATGPFTTIGSAGMNATGFTDTTTVAGTHYYYRVRGVNFDAAGPFSNTADAIAPAPSQTVVGTAGNDTITIKKDATDPTKDDVWVNVPTTGPFTQQVSNGQSIVIVGGGVASGGTDTLVIDSSNGNPIPTGAAGTVLRLDSGTGNFTLGGTLPTLDATHVVDLAKSTLNIPYTGTSPLPTIQTALKSGFIKSTDAAASSGKFGIADVDANSKVTLSYRIIGDLNGDGTVAFADLLTMAQNYNKTGKDWSTGDLTYDGTVNFNDLLALAQHYNQSAAAAPAVAAASPVLAADTLDSTLLKKKSRK